MFRIIFPATILFFATSASAGHGDGEKAEMHKHEKAQPHASHKATHEDGEHEHGEHDHKAEVAAAAKDADAGAMTTPAGLMRNDEINTALEAGGQPVVADVLGVVCDFCAKAMNKTFGKRDEVAAVYVDLDTKTLNLVFKPDATMADDEIEKLVKKAGYKIAGIRRGDAALTGVTSAADPS